MNRRFGSKRRATCREEGREKKGQMSGLWSRKREHWNLSKRRGKKKKDKPKKKLGREEKKTTLSTGNRLCEKIRKKGEGTIGRKNKSRGVAKTISATDYHIGTVG